MLATSKINEGLEAVQQLSPIRRTYRNDPLIITQLYFTPFGVRSRLKFTNTFIAANKIMRPIDQARRWQASSRKTNM